MNYQEVRIKIVRYGAAGGFLVITAGLFTVVSILKFFYFGIDSGDALSHAIAVPLANIVYGIYSFTTPYLEWIWQYAALPSLKNYISLQNACFFIEYLVLMRISDEGDRPFRDRDRRFRQRDRPFRERDRADRTAGLALRMTSTTRVMLAGFGRRDDARAPDEHAHDQGRFTT